MWLDRIVSELSAILESESFPDYGPNGLQVPGPADVRTVVTGVSANESLFLSAAQADAQLVLVHHGLFWDGMPRHVDRALYRRLKPLFEHEMGLVAYHLPLDAHPEHGNNALLAEALGCERRTPAFAHKGRSIGMEAAFGDDGIGVDKLHARVKRATDREPLVLDYGPERVRTIGIVTGAGASYLDEAIARGLDAFLTGEPAERVMAQAREAGIHFIAGGHYATETFGVRRLGDLISQRFGVESVFLDDPNPI
jgi:dinuclear metal center YbgI/SA1388 family protein